jgi:hypothetical protein
MAVRKQSKKRCAKKGCASKTRKGRLDYVTHKGSKYYNRRGHRQTRNAKGVKGRPYSRRKASTRKRKSAKKQKSLFSQILGI